MNSRVLLSTPAAAKRAGCSISKLEKKRVTGIDPIPYLKIGRSVVYDAADIDAWLDAHRRFNTSA